jgi:hypothetical protein
LSGGILSKDLIPVGGSTRVGVTDAARRLVVVAGVSLRAVSRVFEIFLAEQGADAPAPSASGVRWWMLRMGLFALREPLEIADDWFYMIDHSVQIGTVKVCLILGARLSELPSPPRPLRQEDLRLLALIPTENSNGKIVQQQLEEASRRTGIPREIASDHGSDVKSGSELFAAEHPETLVVYDAAHYGACVLKRRFEGDARWASLLGRLGQTKSRIQQTPDAYLMSPSLRPKARYMNLASLLRWCRQILKLLARGSAGGPATARAMSRYGWLKEFQAAIGEWSRWEATVRDSVSFIRTSGLYRGCEIDLQQHLNHRLTTERHRHLETEMCQFARDQSQYAKPGERLVGSTEVIESVFGKWKNLERQESSSGITTLVLGLGSLLGQWTTDRIKLALEKTPVKNVVDWCARNLPPSIQSLRRRAFADDSP